MLPDMDRLLSEPEPEITIFDDTYGTERSARKQIEEDLKQIHLSSWDFSGLDKEGMVIAFQSLVFLTARDASRRATELEGTVHLRKEDIQNAVHEFTNWLITSPIDSVQIFDMWKSRVTQFLKSELRNETRREAVFKTCERFKIDTVDFRKIFSTLPK